MGADSPLRGGIEMRKPSLVATAALLAIGIFVAAPTHSADTYIENLKNKPEPTDCFESRDGYSNVTRTETAPGSPNVKCSNKTGGVLWWGDAFEAPSQRARFLWKATTTTKRRRERPGPAT